MSKIHLTDRIDEDIVRRLRNAAAREGRPKSQIHNELLRKAMRAEPKRFTSWAMKEGADGE